MIRNTRSDSRRQCNSADPKEAKVFEEDAIAKLRGAGLRVTSPRVQVIRALSRSNCALSPYEIHSVIESVGAKVDVVSVYRILQALMDTGLVHRIGVLDGYFACRAGSNHGEDMQHFVCRNCGCVQEISAPKTSSERIASEARDLGFQMEAVHVEVLGTCAHCLNHT